MKKSIIVFATVLSVFALAGCRKDLHGTLKISGLDLDMEIEKYTTKAQGETPALNDFRIIVNDFHGKEVYNQSWAAAQSGSGILLPIGSYTVSARSTAEAPKVAEFDAPVYGSSTIVAINGGETTDAGTLKCSLLQTKVTVEYTEEFLSLVTGKGTMSVTITEGNPLDFVLDYVDGAAVPDTRAGYFTVPEGAVMTIRYSGEIEGQTVLMTKAFGNIRPNTWHKLIFQKKINNEGNANFDISIVDLITDEELNTGINPEEEDSIAEDPQAPVGDGGITLVSTCGYDLAETITVPQLEEKLVLTMRLDVPNKVNKLVVEIESTNPDFPDAVALINDGNTTLDLVNPSEGAIQVFTTILPFPYGESVKGKDSIDFDLSDAQAPILGFKGVHKFVLSVSDYKGCKKSIPVTLAVE